MYSNVLKCGIYSGCSCQLFLKRMTKSVKQKQPGKILILRVINLIMIKMSPT